MEFGLKGRVALVTGTSSQIGYGKGIALALAKEGCDLAITYNKNSAGAQQTTEEIKALGRDVIAIKADVCSSSEVKEMVKAALAHFGKLDILVNNAGGPIGLPRPFVETSESDWDKAITLNLRGTMSCTRAVLEHMISRKTGKIINISSSCAKYGGLNTAAYSAAKAGVITFTKALAVEVAALGINVNCIAPGFGMTDLGRSVPSEIINDFLKTTPLRRMVTPEDIGNAVVYLASDVSSDMVGQTLTLDGGATMC